LDFQDFLRQRGMKPWEKESAQAIAVRNRYRSDQSDGSDPSDKPDRLDAYGLRKGAAEVAANTLICLINQASYLLGRQMQTLERSFLKEGGFTERMYRERHSRRGKQ
jgi:four helix bundle suffix protein